MHHSAMEVGVYGLHRRTLVCVGSLHRGTLHHFAVVCYCFITRRLAYSLSVSVAYWLFYMWISTWNQLNFSIPFPFTSSSFFFIYIFLKIQMHHEKRAVFLFVFLIVGPFRSRCSFPDAVMCGLHLVRDAVQLPSTWCLIRWLHNASAGSVGAASVNL